MVAILDRFLNFAISKKLTVFAIGTVFLYLEKLENEQWIHLALMYIGTQGIIDLYKEIKK